MCEQSDRLHDRGTVDQQQRGEEGGSEGRLPLALRCGRVTNFVLEEGMQPGLRQWPVGLQNPRAHK